MSAIRTSIKEAGNVDALLGRLPLEMREKRIKKALKKAIGVVVKEAKRRAPKPGYPGDKPDKKPLKDTIGSVIRGQGDKIIAVGGPLYPAGAHGHLIEDGHQEVLWGQPTGRRVPAYPFLRPAADETKEQQTQAMIDELKKPLT